MMVHVMFKVKYCHKIFDDVRVEKRCAEILRETACEYGMQVDCIGFDRDHLHAIVDIGLLAIWQAVKLFKGKTAKLLLREFPHLKRQYFWASGLWNPSYWADSVGAASYEAIQNYVKNQGKKPEPIQIAAKAPCLLPNFKLSSK